MVELSATPQPKVHNAHLQVQMTRPHLDDRQSDPLTVGTLSPGKVLSCAPDLPLGRAVSHMKDNNCSSIVVVRSNKPVGIITEKDILSLPADSHSALIAPIENRMSRPAHTISVHASQKTAIVRMRDLNVRHLITVDEQGHLAGIISQTDLIRQVAVSKAPVSYTHLRGPRDKRQSRMPSSA